MRRIAMVILCCLVLATCVSAAGVTSAESQTIVSANGNCDVTLTMTLSWDGGETAPVFPLPGNARDITINGKSASISNSGGVRNVSLKGYVAAAGTYTLVLHYTLEEVVELQEKDALILTIPLLSGFAYPVERLQFSITLPGTVDSRPSFNSTYYQDSVDIRMTITREGATITGVMNEKLPDHETLVMTLPVSEEMFPQSMAKRWSMDSVDLLMIGVALLAIVYFLLTMRFPLPQRLRRAMPPEGLTAGELGCRLTGAGVDFTMMVISWAQMGYLLIQPDDNGRVLLHKRMDMGNERSDFENRYFRSLFGRRKVVDGTGYHYARLCRKAAGVVPGVRNIYLRGSGNPKVFRILMAVIGTLSGVSLALAFASDTGWRIVLGILLGIVGSVVAWVIQHGAGCLHRRDKTGMWLGVGCGAVWMGLSISAGEWNVALFVILAQYAAGLIAAYGGRRTDMGQQDMAEILGLRRYLKTVSQEDMKRILQNNPEHYYTLIPYAMALGVDRAFTRQIGTVKLPECTYLTTGMDGHMTAREFTQLLRDTADSLDALQKRMPIDKLLGR